MFAECLDRMRRSACDGCERRDACSHLFPEALSVMFRPKRPPVGEGERPPAAARSPFMAFLGEVAKAIESNVAEARAKPRRSAFRAEVERELEPMLPSGEVGIDRVARELGCSRQTLYRRLKAEGVTFERLLDALRHRLAIRLIRDEGLSVKDAAWRLGFSDPAAFSRAFKRWTGNSPRDVRGEGSRAGAAA
jgi:AraC-like DNA-binding protein